jgi:hypothetical protein
MSFAPFRQCELGLVEGSFR